MENYMLLAPELILALVGLAILLSGLFLGPNNKNILGYVAGVGLFAAPVSYTHLRAHET